MQSFQINQVNAPGAAGNNNFKYVFVDEHNRHKRLKVMRACEGCRKRKIKCDAATTNSWPCAACKRLKLTCVPPVGGIDGEIVDGTEDGPLPQDHASQPLSNEPSQYDYSTSYAPNDANAGFHVFDENEVSSNYVAQDFEYPTVSIENEHFEPSQMSYLLQNHQFLADPSFLAPYATNTPQPVDAVTVEDLADNLGGLKMPDDGVPDYIKNSRMSRTEAPAPVQEEDDNIPTFLAVAGMQVQIPPTLMPSDEEASQAFLHFFKHVNPYVPVLCRSFFYQAWHHNRAAMSPLLLEAVFACAGQVSGDPTSGSHWLSMANKHEDSFTDRPRLSTIQALLLLLKARERAPRKGYYYRSWQTIKKIVSMAKDLDLHEHFELHQSGGNCESVAAECLVKTRIWQVTMICEIMIGGPQGRYDFGVNIDTVDIRTSPPNSNIDDYEKMISRQFAYWVRHLRNVRGMTEVYYKLGRKNENWGADPKFVAYNEDFRRWPSDIPPDLQIHMPLEGVKPKLQSHFLANVHCHYHLGIVMLYKPQLSASDNFLNDEKWKHAMNICYNSAKMVCVYQETILAQYDIMGLACMLRGLSFPIYATLSCIMVHIIAITSPNSSWSEDAKSYFVRHMRVLEKCIAEWPMPEVREQIDNLRAAFSADMSKPFSLRASFPYGTPSSDSYSPGGRRSSEPPQQRAGIQIESSFQPPSLQHSYSYQYTTAVDPVAANNSAFSEYNRDASGQYHALPAADHVGTMTSPVEQAQQWNPTPIIDQFNMAFALPQSALAPPPPSTYGSSPPLTTPPPMPAQNIHAQMHRLQQQQQQQQHNQLSAVQHPTFSATSPCLDPDMSTSYMTSGSMAQTTPSAAYLTPSPPIEPPPRMLSAQAAANANAQAFLIQQQMQVQMLQQSQAAQQSQQQLQQQPLTLQQTAQGFGFQPPPQPPPLQPQAVPVYATARQWQQAVANVIDPGGLKRKWNFDNEFASAMHSH